MGSVSEWTQFGISAGAVFAVLLATVAGIISLLLFILVRRAVRARYFARRDVRNQFIRQHWDAITGGEIPASAWFFDPVDHALVENIALDRLEVAEPAEADRLQIFLGRSGLLDKRIREVRTSGGWARRGAAIALGRMRSVDGVPALSETLKAASGEFAVDVIHALGQVGVPRAADAILERIERMPLQCPLPVLQGALGSCFRSDPNTLLARVLASDDATRPLLARVLADIAQPGVSQEVLKLVADPLPEVRAAAARVLAATRPAYALLPLTRLAVDKEWFVRLRAVVALGALGERRGIPALVRALCDANRLVRLRAAASLVRFEGQEAHVLQLAMRTRDRYAVQALVSELDRAGRIVYLAEGLADDDRRALVEPALLAVLRGGAVQGLTDLLVRHPNRQIRARLARVMVASHEAGLLELLVPLEASHVASREPRLLRWVISRLRRAPAEHTAPPEELAV
jgi:HEAT repeat protein